MELKEFEVEFQKQLRISKINLEDFQIEQFYKYMQLLIQWNEKINLTNIIEPKEIIVKHFLDSLMVLKYVKSNDKIIDVGTGAGFPGIPIKIVIPETKITLLDSLNKRINFLKDVINNLELEQIESTHARAEEAGQNSKTREKYDIAISRAVAPLNVLLEYLVPFVKVGGTIICMKASKGTEELIEGKNAINKLNIRIIKEDKANIPGTQIERNILIFEKEKTTNKIYPRKAGIPSKKPL